MTRDDFIPVCSPLVGEREKRYLAECIDTGWISSEGPFVARLEEGMARRMRRRHAVAVANGTAALDVAFAALGIGPGDEVILPSFTIISCVLQVVRAGAIPIFVDCSPETWCMDVGKVEENITPRTRAVLAVHIYGLPVDVTPLAAVCDRHGVTLVEDAAQAIGLRYGGEPCGGFGKISTVSFYPNKFVTTGEGGLVLTDDDGLAERCRSLRNLCFVPKERFLHHELGWNYRMSNLQAAVGVAQMERLDETVERKKEIGRWYAEALGGEPGLRLAPVRTESAENVFWAVGVVLGGDLGSAFRGVDFMRRLGEMGIGTRPFFRPLHEQPALRQYLSPSQPPCPVSETIARFGFYLPNGLGLTERQLQRVADSVRAVIREGA